MTEDNQKMVTALGAKDRGGRILAILDRDLYLNENAVEMQSMKH